MLRFQSIRRQPRELRFIERRARKRQCEALDPSPCLSRKRRDCTGVQPARKKQAHGHVGDEMRAHCILEKRPQLFPRGRKIARFTRFARRG